MSIYQKLSNARADFHSRALKKSGKNSFAGYSYFELSDFLIPGMDCMNKQGLVPVISFGVDVASMTIHDTESNDCIVITSPMSSAALKGCHEVQNLGAVQTYLRRYLWVAALEIVEHDAVDSAAPTVEKASRKLLDQLSAAVEQKGKSVSKLLDYYKVDRLGDLSKEQAQQALDMVS